MLYLIIVPPWQHYDEPTHFEYAWWLASKKSIPRVDDYDQTMRRSVAASMVEYGFFYDLDFTPNLLARDIPVWIGVSQRGEMPGYYAVASLALQTGLFVQPENQLRAVRAISVILYIATLLAAYGIAAELTPPGHPLRWFMPVTVLLLPAFADLMSAVNNDVGATAMFSLYLWLGVRTIRRGLTARRLTAFVLTGLTCVLIKSNIAVAVPMLVLVMTGIYLKDSPLVRLSLVFLLIIGFGSTLPFLLSRNEPAYWYRTVSAQPFEVRTSSAGHGNQALVFTAPAAGPSTDALSLYQPLALSTVTTLRNTPVTLGAWMWADRPTIARMPILWIDGIEAVYQVTLDTQPSFFRFQVSVPAESEAIQVNLRPFVRDATTGSTVFFDGLVLVPGDPGSDEPPTFSGPDSHDIRWNGQSYVSLLRNPSFETSWISLNPQPDEALRRFANVRPYLIVATLQDLGTHGWVYLASALNLFQSFWARFAWNQVFLPSGWYWALFLLTLVSLAGAIKGLSARWRSAAYSWRLAVLWLAFGAVVLWASALLRLNFPHAGRNLFIPSARYAYPAIIPTVALLTAGWYCAVKWIGATRYGPAALVTFLAVLDLVSIHRILTFFR